MSSLCRPCARRRALEIGSLFPRCAWYEIFCWEAFPSMRIHDAVQKQARRIDSIKIWGGIAAAGQQGRGGYAGRAAAQTRSAASLPRASVRRCTPGSAEIARLACAE